MNKIISIMSAGTLALGLATTAQATLIDNGLITTDDVNNLEWLDLTLTRGDSLAETVDRITSGDLSGENWRYATDDEVALLFAEAGATLPFDGWSLANNGLADPLMDLWGSTFNDGSVRSALAFIADDDNTLSGNTVAVQNSMDADVFPLEEDFFDTSFGNYGDQYPEIAHALVRDYSSVPEPSTLALFGLALAGLGLSKRKYNTNK